MTVRSTPAVRFVPAGRDCAEPPVARKPDCVSDGDTRVSLRRSGLPVPLRRSFVSRQEAQSRERWGYAGVAAPLGAARAPSPVVRFAHPGLHSLDADFAPPSWLRSSATPAPGHGQPRAGLVSFKQLGRLAAMVRAHDAGHGPLRRFAPRLTALGSDRARAAAKPQVVCATEPQGGNLRCSSGTWSASPRETPRG